jgi:hypothetical protein
MRFKKLTYKDFKKYFSNNMVKKEKHDFEKQMMQDDFENEAFDGLSMLSNDEFENDIAEIKSQIKNKTQSQKRIVPVWFKYAASVIVLIGFSFLIYLIDFTKDDIYKEEQITQETKLEKDKSDKKLEEELSLPFEEEIVDEQDAIKEEAIILPEKNKNETLVVKSVNKNDEVEETAEIEKLTDGETEFVEVAELDDITLDDEVLEKVELNEENVERSAAGVQAAILNEEEFKVAKSEMDIEADVFYDSSGENDIVPSAVAFEEVKASKQEKKGKTRKASYELPVVNEKEAEPVFEGGIKAYKQYIIDTLDYTKFKNFEGLHEIHFSFTVNELGLISHFQFQEIPDSVFVYEIIHVIENGVEWNPAIEKRQVISSEVNMKIELNVK